MSSDWKASTLGEFVRLQRGHDLTSTEQRQGPFPVMGSAGPNGTHAEFKANGPGVVIGRSGSSMGRLHFVESQYWPHNTCLYVTDFFGNSERFAYYLLSTLDLASFNSGSAQPSLNRNYIYSMPIQVPSRKVQDEIVELLGSIDDQITLLRDTNETLEAIAQAIFKSWFVDFDPVKAKAQGLDPAGIDKATAAMFPDSFDVSVLGSIPMGWQVGTIGDLLSECSERAKGRAIEVLSAVQTGELVRSSDLFTKKVFSDDTSKYKVVDPLSFAYNPSRINIGSIGLNESGGLGIVSPIYVVLKPHCSEDAYFFWHNLRTISLKNQIEGLSSGSVRQSLSARDFLSIRLTIPERKILTRFMVMRRAIFDLIGSNLDEIKTLSELRDTLLLRLISGKLKLPETLEAPEIKMAVEMA